MASYYSLKSATVNKIKHSLNSVSFHRNCNNTTCGGQTVTGYSRHRSIVMTTSS